MRKISFTSICERQLNVEILTFSHFLYDSVDLSHCPSVFSITKKKSDADFCYFVINLVFQHVNLADFFPLS